MKILSWDYLISTLLLFLVMVIVPIMFSFDVFEPMTKSLSDFKLSDIVDSQIVPRSELMADTNMILINTEINHKPISNYYLAQLINIINHYHPKVIAIDHIIKKSNNQKKDKILAKILSRSKNIVFSEQLTKFNSDLNQFTSIISSNPMYSKYATQGYKNLLITKDEQYQNIRRFTPKTQVNGKEYFSFCVKVAQLYSQTKANKLFQRNNETEFIKYLGQNQFYRLDLADVFQNNFSEDLINNKIVLLGTINTQDKIDSSMSLSDVYFTPLNKTFTGKAFPDMHGTILRANIISMILNENYIDSMPVWLIYLITIITIYINMIIFTYIVIKNKKWYEILSLAVFVIESLLVLIVTIIGLVFFSFEMDLTILVFAIALSVMIYEIYNSSLKPLSIKTYYKYFHKGG